MDFHIRRVIIIPFPKSVLQLNPTNFLMLRLKMINMIIVCTLYNAHTFDTGGLV